MPGGAGRQGDAGRDLQGQTGPCNSIGGGGGGGGNGGGKDGPSLCCNDSDKKEGGLSSCPLCMLEGLDGLTCSRSFEFRRAQFSQVVVAILPSVWLNCWWRCDCDSLCAACDFGGNVPKAVSCSKSRRRCSEDASGGGGDTGGDILNAHSRGGLRGSEAVGVSDGVNDGVICELCGGSAHACRISAANASPGVGAFGACGSATVSGGNRIAEGTLDPPPLPPGQVAMMESAVPLRAGEVSGFRYPFGFWVRLATIFSRYLPLRSLSIALIFK